jgi:hypothetical protein
MDRPRPVSRTVEVELSRARTPRLARSAASFGAIVSASFFAMVHPKE